MFNKQNQWRLGKAQTLFVALRDEDNEQIELAESSLLVPATSAGEFGFRYSDYEYLADVYRTGKVREEADLARIMGEIGRVNARLQSAHGPEVGRLCGKRAGLFDRVNETRKRMAAFEGVIDALEQLAGMKPATVEVEAPMAVKETAMG